MFPATIAAKRAGRKFNRNPSPAYGFFVRAGESGGRNLCIGRATDDAIYFQEVR
jgi:hypothetical protein